MNTHGGHSSGAFFANLDARVGLGTDRPFAETVNCSQCFPIISAQVTPPHVRASPSPQPQPHVCATLPLL